MAANMNKMIAPAAYSDLDARTQFVLNRVEFLKSIPKVLENENLPASAAKVAVWRDNNYIALVVRCIMDPNEEVYDHAIWATANLLGSDDERVREMTRNAITDEVLLRLVAFASQKNLSGPVRNGVYYLLYNLSKYPLTEKIASKIGGDGLKTVLELAANKALLKDAASDFLCALQNIAKDNAKAVNTELLVSALNKFPFHTSVYRHLLSIVGTLAEQENSRFSPNDKDALMKHFGAHIMEVSGRQRREMLWILSNLLAEGGVEAVMFWRIHKELRQHVVDIAWDELCAGKEEHGSDAIGYEALFALANFLSSAKNMSDDFKHDVADDYVLESLLSSCCGHENARIGALARETLETFDSFKPVVVRPAEPEVIDLTGDSDTEATESEVEDAGEDTEEETDCLIHNRPPLARTDEQIGCCEGPVPSAADLLLGFERGRESANVRRIVQLLVNMPVGEWAEVPADWSVTVADLTVLQHLGYVIVDGWVGINPEIYSGY
jgi:hypothetical protein